jgi:hypothetical protein
MSMEDERPREPVQLDTLPLQTAQYHQYRATSRADRVLRFFQRLGEAFGGGFGSGRP